MNRLDKVNYMQLAGGDCANGVRLGFGCAEVFGRSSESSAEAFGRVPVCVPAPRGLRRAP